MSYDGFDFSKYVFYDEKSPSCLRFSIEIGRGVSKKYPSDPILSTDKDGYYRVGLNGCEYKAHRIVLCLHGYSVDNKIADHIDGNVKNNKIDNLRVVDFASNSRNQKIQRNNNSGKTGVQVNRKYCVAQFNDPINNKVVRRYFSIEKLGFDKAFEMACHERDSAISKLIESGFDYTERHGN